MQEVNETQEQNCVGRTVQREARCTNDLLGFSDSKLLDLCGYAQNWTYYLNDSLESGTVWHLDKEKTPFGRTLHKRDWNPLEDDTDAFQLMVKFELQIHFVEDSDCFWVDVSLPAHSNYELEQDCRVFDSVARKNVAACTRRAIVLAVAQIGRART